MALRWSLAARSSLRAVTPVTSPAAAFISSSSVTRAATRCTTLATPLSATRAAPAPSTRVSVCARSHSAAPAAAAQVASVATPAPAPAPSAAPAAAPAFAHFPSSAADAGFAPRAAMPGYMQRVYWWAYLQPWSPSVFDHPLVVNAILWGNYNRLRDAAVAEYTSFLASRSSSSSSSVASPASVPVPAPASAPPADCLQIACAYGSVSPSLYSALPPGARLELLDISTVQLGIAADKLSRGRVSVPLPGPARAPAAAAWEGLGAEEAGEGEAGPVAGATVFCDRAHAPLHQKGTAEGGQQQQQAPTRVTLRQGDAMNLSCYRYETKMLLANLKNNVSLCVPCATVFNTSCSPWFHMSHRRSGEFGYVLSFFLLHEVPASVRRRAVAEAFRVAAPGGKVVFVDYHEPVATNPVKPIMKLGTFILL